jgi:D-amino-acid dehydrogenase
MAHIAIIGAGITGITTAYSLLNRGFAVTIFERHRYAAMETSFANGGQLSACNAEVWNNWATVRKGVRWMLDTAAPLLMNPKPSWHKYSWIAEFIGNMRHYRANTVATVRLAIEARKALFQIAEREGLDFDLRRNGILHVYKSKSDFAQAECVNRLLAEGGLERHAVGREEIAKIEPSLREDYFGGFYTPSDATGDIHKFTNSLADVCTSRGAKIRYGTIVTSVRFAADGLSISYREQASTGSGNPIEQADFDGVVVCAGVRSRDFAKYLGDRINIYPVKGYSITLHLDDPASREGAPGVGLLDESAKIVTSRLGPDRFRIAGTAEFNGENHDIRADRIKPLIEWSTRLFPSVSTRRAVPWCGLRPMTPSMMPRVERGQKPGVFYNTGHGHLGWTLSAATAELIAEKIVTSLGKPGAGGAP